MVKEIVEGDIIRRANIPLIINSYEDIFSVFDPRPFSERALSDDFLIECKKAARDKDNVGIELVIAVPEEKRNLNDEFKIKKRLREHFKKHFLEKEKEIFRIKKRGLSWIFYGFFAVVAAILIKALWPSLVIDSVIEPLIVIPGWFTIWEGLSRLLVQHEEKKPDYDFYKKMVNCQIVFNNY
jgi:hypothetical protein